jgi:hypothetical protein
MYRSRARLGICLRPQYCLCSPALASSQDRSFILPIYRPLWAAIERYNCSDRDRYRGEFPYYFFPSKLGMLAHAILLSVTSTGHGEFCKNVDHFLGDLRLSTYTLWRLLEASSPVFGRNLGIYEVRKCGESLHNREACMAKRNCSSVFQTMEMDNYL